MNAALTEQIFTAENPTTQVVRGATQKLVWGQIPDEVLKDSAELANIAKANEMYPTSVIRYELGLRKGLKTVDANHGSWWLR